MEIDKNEDQTILNDRLSLNFIYSKDELADIYARRNEYKDNKAKVLGLEDFVDYFKKIKLNRE